MCTTAVTAMRHPHISSKRNQQHIAKAACGNHTKYKLKSVRFAGTVKVSLKAVSQQELKDTWYAPLEYRDFQKESKQSLKAVTKNLCGDVNAYDASQHCLRGLEACLSPQVYRLRKEEKVTVVNEVLKHQLFHRLVGVNDPDHLALISKGISQRASERALLLAALDCRDHSEHQGECI